MDQPSYTFVSADGKRKLEVFVDFSLDLLTAVPYGSWKGFNRWPYEGGTSISFTTDHSKLEEYELQDERKRAYYDKHKCNKP